MNTQKQPIPEKYVLDFMHMEYETLRDFRSVVLSEGESRVNFFLATVSGALVGLALISQSSDLEEVAPIITGIVVIGLFLFGLITFARIVHRDIRLDLYARGLNRIRRYFAQLSPDIKDYLILPLSDDTPSFKSGGFLPRGSVLISLSGMIAVINSTIACITVSISAKAAMGLSTLQVIVTSTLTFAIIYLAQYRYYVVRLREAERKTEVHFPTSK